MKSLNAIQRYIDAGHTVVKNPPAGHYLSDGEGNYQRIDDEIAEQIEGGEAPDDFVALSFFCSGCDDDCDECTDEVCYDLF